MYKCIWFAILFAMIVVGCADTEDQTTNNAPSQQLVDESTLGLSGSPKGTPGAQNGDFNYCDDPNHRCVVGEGDCDSDLQCDGDAVCGANNGAQFGLHALWDICVPAHCVNAQKDGNELGIDCGGDCGQCLGNTCQNQIKDSNENGVDCGGVCNTPCLPMDTCNNGIKDDNEQAVDCGGPCRACQPDQSHCENNVFDPLEGEIAVDCGGPCGRCAQPPAWCDNGVYDSDKAEDDLDCGGECPDCTPLEVSIDDDFNNKIITDPSPKLTGRTNGHVVEISLDGQFVGEVRLSANSSNKPWSFSVPQALSLGTHILAVKAKTVTRQMDTQASFTVSSPPMHLCPAGTTFVYDEFVGDWVVEFGDVPYANNNTDEFDYYSAPYQPVSLQGCGESKVLNGPAVFHSIYLEKGESVEILSQVIENGVNDNKTWVWVTDDCQSSVLACDELRYAGLGVSGYTVFTAPESKTYYIAYQTEKALALLDPDDDALGSQWIRKRASFARMTKNSVCARANMVLLPTYNQDVVVTDSDDIANAPSNYSMDADTCQQNIYIDKGSYLHDRSHDVVYQVDLAQNDILDIDVDADFTGMVWVAKTCDGNLDVLAQGSVGQCQGAKLFDKNTITTLSYPSPQTGRYYVLVSSELGHSASYNMKLTMRKRK